MFSFRRILGGLRGRDRRQGTSPRKPARPRLVLEALDDRSLPSATNVFTLPPAANGSAILVEQIVRLGSNLYFTTGNDDIGRITTSGQITLNFAPGGTDLAVGADGNLWTALGNTIERITPSGAVTNFTAPTPGAGATSITAGPDGNLWFTETDVDQVGEINPTTGAITEFPVTANTLYESPAFGGITAGPDGNFWFTEPVFYQVGRITPGGAETDFALPTTAGEPEQITAGPDGNVWFTLPGFGSVLARGPIENSVIEPAGVIRPI